jgi:hypothetical protein
LVVYNKDGEPETVAYHLLASLLLEQLQEEHRRAVELADRVAVQGSAIAALGKQIDGVEALEERLTRLEQHATTPALPVNTVSLRSE